jgi:hypothetical protein
MADVKCGNALQSWSCFKQAVADAFGNGGPTSSSIRISAPAEATQDKTVQEAVAKAPESDKCCYSTGDGGLLGSKIRICGCSAPSVFKDYEAKKPQALPPTAEHKDEKDPFRFSSHVL